MTAWGKSPRDPTSSSEMCVGGDCISDNRNIITYFECCHQFLYVMDFISSNVMEVRMMCPIIMTMKVFSAYQQIIFINIDENVYLKVVNL